MCDANSQMVITTVTKTVPKNLILLIKEALRVHLKFILPLEGEYGTKLPDGNWTGMIGRVQRAEADLAVDLISITEERFQACNFSYPFFFTKHSFMTEKPKPISASLTLLYPFSLTVWIILAALVLFVSLVLFYLIKPKITFSNVLTKIFGSVLQQSINIKSRKRNIKVILNTWILSIFVLSSSYKTLLLAFLSIPPLVGIKDIKDLARAAEQNSISCYTYKGGFSTQIFLDSDFDTWKSIGECLQRSDKKKSFIDAPHKAVFIGDTHILETYKEKFFISEDSFFNTMYAFPVSKP